MMNYIKVLLALITCGFFHSAAAQNQSSLVNVALGKKVTFSTKPNYVPSMDAGDNIQLTDGKYSGIDAGKKFVWQRKDAVVWKNVKPVVITIDLGSVQPIVGVSLSTAANQTDTFWPEAIYVAVSVDGKTWYDTGNLVELARKDGAAPTQNEATFRYTSHNLKTKGRYIAFSILQFPLAVVDEIEVYQGDAAWLRLPAAGSKFLNIADFNTRKIINTFVKKRLNADIASVRKNVEQSHLQPAAKSTFEAELDQDADATAQIAPLSADKKVADFKTILPLNDIHRDILAVHGKVLSAQGFQNLTVWKQPRNAWLPLIATPNKTVPELHFSMLKNQFRTDALLLTNAGATPLTAQISLKDIPHEAQNGWLKIDSVAWTDTLQSVPVADALIPVQPQNDVYEIDVPAGMTRKVWFTVDSSKVPSGAAKSTFEISGGGQKISVPLNVDISSLKMERPRLSLSMWDYSSGNAYAITPDNHAAAFALMKSHFVDTTWGSQSVLPQPGPAAFDAQDNLKVKLAFPTLDRWIGEWPNARHYFIYERAGGAFAGVKYDTPEFQTRVGSWAKALSDHIQELGLRPNQFGMTLVDEAQTESQFAVSAAWAQAIKATAPDIQLVQTIVIHHPDQVKNQDALNRMNLFILNQSVYRKTGEPTEKYFQQQEGNGKTLWFYMANGPARLLDPQKYYRQQAWFAFSQGAKGEGFWSFADAPPSSWNEYTSIRTNSSPVFLDNKTVHNSIHWDAVRDSVEDYEELSMLRDAINKTTNQPLKAEAENVLQNAVRAVTSTWKFNSSAPPAWSRGDFAWEDTSYKSTVMDAELGKVRQMLETLSYKNPPK